MQSRISVSLAQCSGDPGEAPPPPIFRPRDRPPPLSKGLDDRQPPLSQGLEPALKWKFGGEIVIVSP